ncbi:amidohydrolase family protein [Zhongshania aliphaticivorans]|uniref:amidohydrolase family protein n=1 Tax=Zhongshania aliphaticivorans TaxID=1470434 RepID=UPI0039C8D518
MHQLHKQLLATGLALTGLVSLATYSLVASAEPNSKAQKISTSKHRYSDAHLHIVDFFQEGEPLSKLITAMDKGKIDHAMISGIPLMKKWHEDEPKRPRYYAGDDAGMYWFSATDSYVAEAYRKLPKQDRERLHPFLCGFNPTDKNADKHLRQMLETYPDVWQGIGEVLTRHDDLTALTQDDTPRANNEAMYRVYRVAAEFKLPVLLHSNITSKRERNPLYVGEIEDALAAHPDVNFIWAHAGTSATLHRYQDKLDFLLPALSKLLAAHDNLYIDLSWAVLTPYLLDKNQEAADGWVALINKYPKRFMIGSDGLGSYDKIAANLDEYAPFLDALNKEAAQGVARNNFIALLPKKSVSKILANAHPDTDSL